MSREVVVGSASAGPGAKGRGFIEVAKRPDGSAIRIPVVIVSGAREGPVLVVDACAHAEEVEGALTVLRAAEALDPGRLRGAFIGVPVLNGPAFDMKLRAAGLPAYSDLPQDMARIFPGRADGTIAERIAHAYVREIVSRADLVMHLHGGGNTVFNTERIWVEGGDPGSIELAKAMGGRWDLIIERPYTPGSIQEVCAGRGVPAISPELGGASDRLPERLEAHVASYVDGVLNVMRRYGMLEGEATLPARWHLLDGTDYRIYANNGGLLLYEPIYRLRARISKGATMMRIVDTAGEEVERVAAPFDGIVVGVKASPMALAGDCITLFARIVRTVER